jgi:hypothetical protein
MAKGTIAKQNVINKIAQSFGADYIGEVDKKIYVWAEENGEKVQIALSLTCPKTAVAAAAPAGVKNGGFDFETPAAVAPVASASFEPAEITDEERNNIAAMMARLGL